MRLKVNRESGTRCAPVRRISKIEHVPCSGCKVQMIYAIFICSFDARENGRIIPRIFRSNRGIFRTLESFKGHDVKRQSNYAIADAIWRITNVFQRLHCAGTKSRNVPRRRVLQLVSLMSVILLQYENLIKSPSLVAFYCLRLLRDRFTRSFAIYPCI